MSVQLQLFDNVEPRSLCPGCGGQAFDNIWGSWCQNCGGVCDRPGHVIFRHVATAYNNKVRHPIVYDNSAGDYAGILGVNPDAGKAGIDGDFRSPTVSMAHGSLDAIIALMYPLVKDDGGPFIAASPWATDEEKALISMRY